ncbi:MAG: XdhC family protein [Planctomycetes bacterium]|nr:XdhC family protein [Planctomycetota bacterium]
MNSDVYALLADRVGRGQPCAVVTVVSASGSTPVKAGAKALYDPDGRRAAGWSGGGCIEGALADIVRAALAEGTPRTVPFDLADEVLGVGVPCGGRMEVLVEPVLPDPVLEIVGHGRVAEAVARIASGLSFRVRVHSSFAAAGALPPGTAIVSGDVEFLRLCEVPGSYVVVAAEHKGDEAALARALERNAAHVALVASRDRARIVFDRMGEMGVPAEAIRRVRCPAGLDIGAVTPDEIALSVLAQIVAVKRGKAKP